MERLPVDLPPHATSMTSREYLRNFPHRGSRKRRIADDSHHTGVGARKKDGI